jgi:uncharacterized low-complexity protein
MYKKTFDKKSILNPLTASIGAAVLASALSAGSIQASENPFASSELGNGFMLAGKDHEGKCGENKKGHEGKKDKEGKCGEGKCGEGKKDKEGKCGEGKCGETKELD